MGKHKSALVDTYRPFLAVACNSTEVLPLETDQFIGAGENDWRFKHLSVHLLVHARLKVLLLLDSQTLQEFFLFIYKHAVKLAHLCRALNHLTSLTAFFITIADNVHILFYHLIEKHF
jgi:hypothetical protein